MVDGALPAGRERAAFARELAGAARVAPAVQRALEPIAALANPLDGLLAALPLVASSDGMRKLADIDATTRRRDAIRLIAVVPTLLTALYRLGRAELPVEPRP